jgi:hypothetical protein
MLVEADTKSHRVSNSRVEAVKHILGLGGTIKVGASILTGKRCRNVQSRCLIFPPLFGWILLHRFVPLWIFIIQPPAIRKDTSTLLFVGIKKKILVFRAMRIKQITNHTKKISSYLTKLFEAFSES